MTSDLPVRFEGRAVLPQATATGDQRPPMATEPSSPQEDPHPPWRKPLFLAWINRVSSSPRQGEERPHPLCSGPARALGTARADQCHRSAATMRGAKDIGLPGRSAPDIVPAGRSAKNPLADHRGKRGLTSGLTSSRTFLNPVRRVRRGLTRARRCRPRRRTRLSVRPSVAARVLRLRLPLPPGPRHARRHGCSGSWRAARGPGR